MAEDAGLWEEGSMPEQGSQYSPSVQGAWEVSSGFPDVSLLPAFPSPGSRSQNPQLPICSDQQATDTVRKGLDDEGVL